MKKHTALPKNSPVYWNLHTGEQVPEQCRCPMLLKTQESPYLCANPRVKEQTNSDTL